MAGVLPKVEARSVDVGMIMLVHHIVVEEGHLLVVVRILHARRQIEDAVRLLDRPRIQGQGVIDRAGVGVGSLQFGRPGNEAEILVPGRVGGELPFRRVEQTLPGHVLMGRGASAHAALSHGLQRIALPRGIIEDGRVEIRA